jgi:hypothetical protein
MCHHTWTTMPFIPLYTRRCCINMQLYTWTQLYVRIYTHGCMVTHPFMAWTHPFMACTNTWLCVCVVLHTCVHHQTFMQYAFGWCHACACVSVLWESGATCHCCTCGRHLLYVCMHICVCRCTNECPSSFIPSHLHLCMYVMMYEYMRVWMCVAQLVSDHDALQYARAYAYCMPDSIWV